MISRIHFIGVVGVFLTTFFCSSCGADRSKALRVGAASSMRNSLDSIVAVYEAQTGNEIEVVYGASGMLRHQIAEGAPYDIFLSADSSNIASLSGRTLQSTQLMVGRLAMLGYDPCVVKRVAVPNGEVAPYGIKAMEYLETLGCSDKYQVIRANNASHAVQLYDVKAVDCSISALSLVIDRPLTDRIVVLPVRFQVNHYAAKLRSSPASDSFYQFLSSNQSRLIWEHGGYLFL